MKKYCDLQFYIHLHFRAQNLFGISDWSQSDHIDLENVFKNQPAALSQFGPIIAGSFTGLLLICVLIILFSLNFVKNSQEKKPILNSGSTTAEHELAVLGTPNIGPNGTIVTNTIYGMGDDEFLQLPRINRSQVTIGKFIGNFYGTMILG